MNLRDYLYFNRICNKEFAKKLGKNSSYISLVVNGRKPAGRLLIEAIFEATQGQVTYEDMRKLNMENNEYIQKRIAEKLAKEQACAEIN